ncbi:MAG: UvrD-helicase domain-containing protein [Nanoarchaeota archaeon]|nr:UvrD-helicase domain-containing protein [Nanoarchaeota archaeon]
MEADRKELDYLFVLKALNEIPFSVGRKLLIDFLQGKETKPITRNGLSSREHFGSLAYEKDELEGLIDNLILNNMIEVTPLSKNKFWKVLELNPKGRLEISSPALYKRKLAFNFKQKETIITEEDKKLFSNFTDFLACYNDAQKKAIISNKKQLLCVAGAGTGKTTVLTKRIEFMVKYKSVDPKKILAVTFTRKARKEMMDRLSKVGYLDEVKVETFNSFCEKILKRYNDLVYLRSVRVITYGDKLRVIKKALSSLNTDIAQAINIYFSDAQQRGKTPEQLANIFMNDCFFVRDYFKFKNMPINQASFNVAAAKDELSARMVFGVCNYIEAYMKKNGLRDFADQLLDTISLFEENKSLIPKFDHILIDEYQDVNSTQIKLIDLLNSENIFCVGDPRQSIFGWRGSDIKYILNFEEKYSQCDVITLTKNYRSTKHIVELINNSIRKMGLADLDSNAEGDKDIKMFKFPLEETEFEFVIQCILASKLPRKEIFVLARTNRQLHNLSQILKARGIKHIVRSDEMRRGVIGGEDDITLATIHSIKGLEADMVFVIGCTMVNFPCKGSEHPVIEMIKIDEYDKEEEERRLFYVAMSRARKSLYLTHSGKKPTYFITEKMLEMLGEKEINLSIPKVKVQKTSIDLTTRLRNWRWNISQEMNIPVYMVMNNKTLDEITQRMPATMVDLEEIHGFGPVKVMKYGQEILSIVNG